MSVDTRSLETRLDRMPPRRGQVIIIALCLLLNVADGFDVLAMSYAAPRLAADWSVSPEQLGVVFSAALVGMALGSMVLAPLADTFGRRTMVLIAAALVSGSMFATALSTSVWQLVVLRLLAGLGIGIIVPTSATLTTEYAPARIRHTAVLLVATGFSVGLTLAGLVAEEIITAYGWQGIFVAGGALTTTGFLLSAVLLKESVHYLAASRLAMATKLTRINKVLASLRHKPISSLDTVTEEIAPAIRIGELFTSRLWFVTIQVWLMWFTYYWAAYIITNWMPTLFVYGGYTEAQGIDAMTSLTIGVLAGAVVLGFLSIRFVLWPILAGMLFISAVLIAAWVMFDFDFTAQKFILGAVGFMLSANYGLYSIVGSLYPARIRATGIGTAIGFGRVGGIVAPLITGFAVAAGWDMQQIMLILVASVLVIPGALVVSISRRAVLY